MTTTVSNRARNARHVHGSPGLRNRRFRENVDVDFSEADRVEWRVINDGVMGGTGRRADVSAAAQNGSELGWDRLQGRLELFALEIDFVRAWSNSVDSASARFVV